MAKEKSETKNVSDIFDSMVGEKTYETTITESDGSKTSARGLTPEISQQKASDKRDNK